MFSNISYKQMKTYLSDLALSLSCLNLKLKWILSFFLHWRAQITFPTHVCLLLERWVLFALFRAFDFIYTLLDFRCLINHHLQISIGLTNFSVELNELIVFTTCCCWATHALKCLRCVIINSTAVWTASNCLLEVSNPFLALFSIACLWNWFQISFLFSWSVLEVFNLLESEMFYDRRWWWMCSRPGHRYLSQLLLTSHNPVVRLSSFSHVTNWINIK